MRLNFNALIETLKISVPTLCACTNYDASTLFRIKNGSRRPSDPESFVSDIAGFIGREYSSAENLSSLASLLFLLRCGFIGHLRKMRKNP